jgi:PAS domain S-box-containing protein
VKETSSMKEPASRPPRADNLRARAERSLGRTGREIAAMSTEDVQKMVHELQVHEIELQMQNEELRRAQEEFEEACERYANLYDFATCPLLTLGFKGEIEEANLAAASLLGVERRELVGQKFTRFIRPEAQDTFYLHHRLVFASGMTQVSELELKSVAGDRLTVRLEGVAHKEPGERGTKYRVSLTDITESKRAEEALRRSEKNLADFFDHAPIGLQWLGPDGTILRANQAQLDMLGSTRENYMGRRMAEFDADSSAVDELLTRLAAGETVHNFRAGLKHNDGSIRFVLIDANSHWNEEQFTHSSIFTRDITQRIELEQELLTISEREHRRIARDMHDDLGQLLTAAVYLTSALQKKLEVTSRSAAAEGARILGVLEQALDQTRFLARGLHPVKPEPNGLMAALEELASRTKKHFHRPCRFVCPQPVLIEDNTVATHLYRIAQEAVTNAVKHGKCKRITLELARVSDRITVKVKDNGVGFTIDNPKKNGMGLRIMEYRAGMVGGSLVVRNERKSGTAVICSVPSPETGNPSQ